MVKHQKGMALLMVLMVTATISVVITVQQYKTKANLALAYQANDWMAATAKLESIKEELIFRLSTGTLWLYGPTPELNVQNGFPGEMNFYGKSFDYQDAEITLTDLSGMLGVVPFNEGAWQALLLSLELKNADSLIAVMKDWYDTDDLTHLNGAESRDYEQPGLPRNGIPQTIEELSLLKGMTPEVWQKIYPSLGYIGTGQLNPEFIPEHLLVAMLGEYRAELVREARDKQLDANSVIDRTLGEESTFTPSNRLKVAIRVQVNESAAQMSFVLLRMPGTERITQITEIKNQYFKVVSS